MTGKESFYTVYAGHEVMYHVSTMLPYSKDNPQQLERKRHIGNDIVNIIYTDDPSAVDTFNPNCIRSQFTRKSRKNVTDAGFITRFREIHTEIEKYIAIRSYKIISGITHCFHKEQSSRTADAEIPYSAVILGFLI